MHYMKMLVGITTISGAASVNDLSAQWVSAFTKIKHIGIEYALADNVICWL